MADIEWKPLPTGLWTPPAVFADVENLLLQAFTDDGVPTWEISKKTGNRGEWNIIAKGVRTPSRRPKRRRSSKRKQHSRVPDILRVARAGRPEKLPGSLNAERRGPASRQRSAGPRRRTAA